ncbi:hypothetical protein B0G57_118106 [Trinickia symbiotica]|nr:hypothetical protein B0G57_118106 [Trinickia symbiotica]
MLRIVWQTARLIGGKAGRGANWTAAAAVA